MSEPKPILLIKMPSMASMYDHAKTKEILEGSPIVRDYHLLIVSGETDYTQAEILSIKEMDVEKQNEILDAIDKLMSKN